MTSVQQPQGRLHCIGLGITLGSQLTQLNAELLRSADVVFFHANTQYLAHWLAQFNPALVDLQPFYRPGQSRAESYQAMVDAVLDAVRAGNNVVWACYGHPGIASWPPHEALRQAKAQGLTARMEAGISADACLYADLGIDPIADGCQQYEASQWLFYQRQIDVSALLILWQVCIAGDFSLTALESDGTRLQLLTAELLRYYPADHQVILYEAADLPIWQPRIEHIALADLPKATLNQITTLVLPPATQRQPNLAVLDALQVPADHPLRGLTPS